MEPAHVLIWIKALLAAGFATYLRWGAVLLARSGLTGYPSSRARGAIGVTDLGLAAFVALWLGFILTGLWFSYWVKMGPVQQGHMTLLLVALAGVVVVNLGV